MRWQILCDFDGTITRQDTVVGLLDAFAGSAWRGIDEDALGSRIARAQQTALARASQEDVDRFLDGINLDPGFPGLVAECERLGLPLTIVSDGYDHAIRRVFANNDIANLDIVAHRLVFAPEDRLEVEFPFADKDCAVEAGACKCAAMGRLRNRKSVLIGNGESDFCVAGAADFVFARDCLIDHCRAEGIPFHPFRALDEVTPLLKLATGDGAGLLALARTVAA